jgi:hypothetical protein
MNGAHPCSSFDLSRSDADLKTYKRAMVAEPLRRLCRIADFVLLLTVLRIQKRLPAFAELRKTAFVELGPGPTRLAFIKRVIFRKVFFVDQSDFGIPDPDLRIADLEQFEDAAKIVTGVCGLPCDASVLLFADHCLEHVSENVLLGFLKSIAENGFLACFRVPNVLSSGGYRNFMHDRTHRTSFGHVLRSRIGQMGFAISPWMRWYKPCLIFNALISREPPMNQAEEIAICACGRSGASGAAPVSNCREGRK